MEICYNVVPIPKKGDAHELTTNLFHYSPKSQKYLNANFFFH